jgi:hypothetical protein
VAKRSVRPAFGETISLCDAGRRTRRTGFVRDRALSPHPGAPDDLVCHDLNHSRGGSQPCT